MPTKTIISRIGKVNFFAVLPSGFFICIILFITFLKIVDNEESLGLIWCQMVIFGKEPIAIIITLFMAYILGSVIQINSVYYTEYLTPPKLFRKDTFPFPDELEKNIKRLNGHSPATKHDPLKTPDFQGLEELDFPLTFNYWKDVLSMECPEAFDYYQTHEAQTRFYAGMYISSLIGLICSSIILVRANLFFYYPGFILLLISVILILSIGGQFHRVRKKEANVLLFQYIAYLQKQN